MEAACISCVIDESWAGHSRGRDLRMVSPGDFEYTLRLATPANNFAPNNWELFLIRELFLGGNCF